MSIFVKKLSIVVLLVISVLLMGCNGNKSTESYTKEQKQFLATCLRETGFVLYATTTCPHCLQQKQRFGDAAGLLTIVYCDKNPIPCETMDISGVPTWLSADQKRYVGDKSLSFLAQVSGCSIP